VEVKLESVAIVFFEIGRLLDVRPALATCSFEEPRALGEEIGVDSKALLLLA